jgi:hypothetical protein
MIGDWPFAFAKFGDLWHCCGYIFCRDSGRLYPFHLNSGKAFVPWEWGGVLIT